jgi:hypothetical protein
LTIFHKDRYIKALTVIVLGVLIQPVYALEVNANAKDVATKLNALYQHTEACNNNEPSYYCSGIIVHGQVVPTTDGYEHPSLSWYLPTYRNIGSFSYLRKDITPTTGEPIWVNTGYILTPLDDVEANNQFRYTVHCAYPGDGATFDGLETSCVFSRSNERGEEIFSHDIHSIDTYMKSYVINDFSEWKPNMAIAFPATKTEFDLVMNIYQYLFKDNWDQVAKSICHNKRCRDHNELIISAWEQDKVPSEQVPLLAFFAIINDDQNPFFENTGRTSTSPEEMKQLFADADAYSKATHYTRRIPVVTIDMAKLRKGEPEIFAPAVNPAMDRK